MPAMGAKGDKGPAKSTTEQAIADIVKMNPMHVSVELNIPLTSSGARTATGALPRVEVKLEWAREDTTMPLSELLGRIEAYIAEYGNT